MGFNEEERQSTPPPWGWPPAAEEKAHGVGEIVYHGAAKPTRHTKDRRHEQEKVYHKTRSRATPHGQAARDAGHGMERIREPLRADIAAALREGPQHPVLHVAAGAQARGGVADRQARQPAHEARTVPGRRLLGDRPKEASEARELGHWEMDTVISGRGSRGGLLVMLDRCSRRYVIEHLSHISQDDVVKAIRKMKARKALPVIRSVTTDNGCEFLDQKRLDRVFKAETYYTRAYASYEKGAIENCNRLVRRWYPKGTDFNQLTRRQIRQLEDWINSIHRESLNGETAYAYDSRMAQAA